MKIHILTIALTVLSFGCATQRQETVSHNVMSGVPFEKEISEFLQQQPIPFPQTTPFDSDAKKRDVYLTAFSKAWDYVVSGNALHGTIGFSVPKGFKEPWNAGWKDGYQIASERWEQEFEKLRQTSTRDNSSS